VLFGLSKKAFKRAVGRLLKEGAVTLDEQGYIVPR
jgi:predicted RNA-binding protein (virulence factor B family)